MFKSQNYIFRQTTLGIALEKAGIGNGSQVREDKIDGVLRHPRDRWNAEPSRQVHLEPVVTTKGAFGKSSETNGKKEKQNG